MKKPASQVAHPTPGRIDLYTKTQRKVPVNLTHPLPDGSRLTDQPNERLLQTILDVVEASQPRLEGASFAAVIGPLFILIQWMFRRSIHSFGSLLRHHYENFLVDSARGLDVTIDATPRLHSHLQALANMPARDRMGLQVSELFAAAGIPPSYIPRLPRTRRLATAYIARGNKALASMPSEPLAQPMRWTTLRTRVRAIERLWLLRESLADPAQVQPFPDDVLKRVRMLGTQGQQTEVIPHAVAMKLLIGSLDMVMTLGPAFLDWEASREPGRGQSQLDRERFEHLNALVQQRSRFTLVRATRNVTATTVAATTFERTHIPISCQVALFAYTGRRKVEVEALESNCVKGEQEEGRHLSAYIAKRQTFESRPCPEFVARAVDLMNRYHGHTPTEVQPLFHLRGRPGPMRLVERLDEFAEFVGASTYTDSEGRQRTWHWKAHQFRRLYAIYYIWRYEDSSYLALQHHLGHGSEREAAYYARLASDENFVELVQEAGLFTLDKLREVARGDGGFAGGFSHVIAKRIERARLVLKLTSPKRLEAVLVHLVEEEGLMMQGSPWGYCGCKATASNMLRAKCRQGEHSDRPKHPIFKTPVPEASNEETCSSCHFHATNASREPHWSNVVLRLDKAIEGGRPDSMAVNLLRQRREKVNAAAEKFFGKQGAKRSPPRQ